MALLVYFMVVFFSSSFTVTTSQRYLPPELEQFRSNVIPYMKRIIRKNKLSLGTENCDIGTEGHRKALEKSLLSHMTFLYLKPNGLGAITNNMISTVQEMATIQGDFCNTFANLECAPDPGKPGKTKCRCAKEAETVGFKAFFKQENQSCVFQPGSMCAPQDMMEESSRNSIFGPLPMSELKCSGNITCIVKRTGGKCTSEAMNAEYDRMGASHSNISTETAYKIAHSNDGVCICRGISLDQSIYLILLSTIVSIWNYTRP